MDCKILILLEKGQKKSDSIESDFYKRNMFIIGKNALLNLIYNGFESFGIVHG